MTPTPTPGALDVAAIRERAEKAQSGPWAYDVECGEIYAGRKDVNEDWNGTDVADCFEIESGIFIAAARQDVPALCDEVESLRAEVERLRGQVSAWTEIVPGDGATLPPIWHEKTDYSEYVLCKKRGHQQWLYMICRYDHYHLVWEDEMVRDHKTEVWPFWRPLEPTPPTTEQGGRK